MIASTVNSEYLWLPEMSIAMTSTYVRRWSLHRDGYYAIGQSLDDGSGRIFESDLMPWEQCAIYCAVCHDPVVVGPGPGMPPQEFIGSGDSGFYERIGLEEDISTVEQHRVAYASCWALVIGIMYGIELAMGVRQAYSFGRRGEKPN